MDDDFSVLKRINRMKKRQKTSELLNKRNLSRRELDELFMK
jgi:hypothetical protein